MISSWLSPPADFGFHATRFPAWRADQPGAIRAALEAETKFVGLVLPTGAGKSLTALTIARLTGWRTVYLTSTKALQDQIERDFTPLVTLLKGQSSYVCDALMPGGEYADWNPDAERRFCHDGPCHVGKFCARKGNAERGEPATCAYFHSVSRAMRARIPVTNYAAWLAHRIHAVGLGTTDCLILDEAHAAPDELAGALRVEIRLTDLRSLSLDEWPSVPDFNDEHGWLRLKGWAGTLASDLDRQLETHHPDTRVEALFYRRAQRLHGALVRLIASDPDITLVRDVRGVLTIEPVWAATYVDALWKGIPKVICMSATVRPKTLELLGVSLPETTWFESQGDFPIARRPVIYIPTVRVRHTWTHDDETWWLSRIDDLLRARPGVKGIIHTVSYARRNLILQRSEFRARMVSHDRDDTAAQVERFKRADGPLVLVSPSMTTGYDFPYDECRFQILGKVPFPDGRDPITERRTVLDPDYPAYVAMQELVQSVGRGMRAKDDGCESFIIDNNFSWFIKKYRAFAPKWFLQSVETRDTIPRLPTW